MSKPISTPLKKLSPVLRKSPAADPRFYPAPEPKENALPAGTPRKAKTKHLSKIVEPHIGWVIDSRDHYQKPVQKQQQQAEHNQQQQQQRSSNLAVSSSGNLHSTSLGSTPQSLPKFEHPSHMLLKDNGFAQVVYYKYRQKCTNERKRLGKLIFKFIFI